MAFFSRQLKERERNYAATELECLAVKESIRHFEVYLHGREFVVQTDHKALESLLKSTQLNSKLARWALYLQQFSMEIKYRPGVINQNADGLSRQAWEDNDEGHMDKSEDGGEKDQEEKDNRVKTGEMSGNVLWLTRHHYEHCCSLFLYHCFIVCDMHEYSVHFCHPGSSI